jgi:hypothetical protein
MIGPFKLKIKEIFERDHHRKGGGEGEKLFKDKHILTFRFVKNLRNV